MQLHWETLAYFSMQLASTLVVLPSVIVGWAVQGARETAARQRRQQLEALLLWAARMPG